MRTTRFYLNESTDLADLAEALHSTPAQAWAVRRFIAFYQDALNSGRAEPGEKQDALRIIAAILGNPEAEITLMDEGVYYHRPEGGVLALPHNVFEVI